MIDHVTLNAERPAGVPGVLHGCAAAAGLRADDGVPRGLRVRSGRKADFFLAQRGEPSGSVHVALHGPDRSAVDAFHEAALIQAGRTTAPGDRRGYHEDYLREHWPQAGAPEYRWSTQDYMSVDRVPFIGRLRRTTHHVHAATGYSKWGMTSGTLAGMLLTDVILGRENPWADLYGAKRFTPKASFKRFVSGNASSGRHWIIDRFKPAEKELDELVAGEGGIVRVRGRKRAAYRDDAGTLHVLSPVCRHLYCHVAWNAAERSWDCPCHGSRYSGEGEVIQGPTLKPLRRLDDR